MNSDFTQDNPAENTYDETMPTAAPGLLRLANHLFDSVLMALVVVVFISLFMPQLMPKSMEELAAGPLGTYMYPVQFLYYFVSEFFFGRTIGKVLTRTYVTTEYNEKPGAGAIFFRTLCRFIPFEFLSFLRNGIGWHDRISKTYVVRAPKN